MGVQIAVLRSGWFPGWIEGMEAFNFCGFEQGGGGGNKDDLGTVEHIASDHGGGKLKRLGPAEGGAIEELASRLKDCGVERLLDHAGGLNAESFECGVGICSRNVSGALATADRRVNLEGRGGGDELAIVLNGLHEADEGIGSLPSHEETGEGSGLEKITGHAFPRST